MSESTLPSGRGPENRDETLSGLFAQLVMQQANMAMMCLGRTPHPQSGKSMRDLEAARLFIDQLEMLAAKTKGNLSHDEDALLRQSLMSLRLAFVEAVEMPAAAEPPPAPPPAPAASSPAAPPEDGKPSEAGPAADPDSKKKFSKKY